MKTIDRFFKSQIRTVFHNSEWINKFNLNVDGSIHDIEQGDSNGFYVAKKWTYKSKEYGYISVMNTSSGSKTSECSHKGSSESSKEQWLQCQTDFDKKVAEYEIKTNSYQHQDKPIETKQDIDITIKYKQQITSAIDIFSQANTSLDYAGEKTENSLFDIAKILVAAKQELGTGRDNKKKFTTLKEFTTTKLGNKSIGNMNKAIKVASDSRIATHQDKLPNRFSVLYALTSLNDEMFNQLLQDGEISPSITRERLLEKVKEIKGESKSKSIQFTIKPSQKLVAIVEDDLTKLKKVLASAGWEIVTKKVKKDS
jgi:hypothetical protein